MLTPPLSYERIYLYIGFVILFGMSLVYLSLHVTFTIVPLALLCVLLFYIKYVLCFWRNLGIQTCIATTTL